jgi:hypothetical protein
MTREKDGMVMVYIDQEVTKGRFRIAGGRLGMKISWQVTGVRQDAHARAHPLSVEQRKTAAQQGKYVSPIEHGKPASAGIAHQPLSVSKLDETRR